MPASASRVQAWNDSGVHSSGWRKWRLIQSGWCLRSIRHSSGVIRCGSTAGIFVPIRRNSTCGISRNRVENPVEPLVAQGQRVAAGDQHVADGRACGGCSRTPSPAGPRWGRSTRGPPCASGCNSGNSSSRSRSPAAAPGRDSDGPSPARGYRRLRPADRRPRPGRGRTRRWWESPSAAGAGLVVAGDQAHVVGRNAHRAASAALARGPPARRPKAPAPVRVGPGSAGDFGPANANRSSRDRARSG